MRCSSDFECTEEWQRCLDGFCKCIRGYKLSDYGNCVRWDEDEVSEGYDWMENWRIWVIVGGVSILVCVLFLCILVTICVTARRSRFVLFNCVMWRRPLSH